MSLSIALDDVLKYTLRWSTHDQMLDSVDLTVYCHENPALLEDWAALLQQSVRISALQAISFEFSPTELRDLNTFHQHYNEFLTRSSPTIDISYRVCQRYRSASDAGRVITLDDFDVDGCVDLLLSPYTDVDETASALHPDVVAQISSVPRSTHLT